MSGKRERRESGWRGFESGEVPGVLLLGASGMLGRGFATELQARKWKYKAPTRAELDLADAASVERAAEWHEWAGARPLVINCAAWTDVDGAEKNEEIATRVNGLEALVGLAQRWEAVLVSFGTDYVFSGQGISPYPVDAPRAPLSSYGRSKAVGEEVLEAYPGEWLNIRTSWLYAPWGKNFVLTMRRLLMEKPVVRVVDDQRGRPTSAEHLARITLALLDRGDWFTPNKCGGHSHVTDGGECTWYEFAKEIGRVSGAPGRVEPCTTAEFPRPAKRPAYSVLDLSKTEELLGPMPDWRENLADVLRRVGP